MTVGMVPPKIALQLSAPWLAERSAADAVRELLGYAEYADPDQRLKALAIARALGQDGAPAWREWARRPGLGAYARAWLSERDEPFAVAPDDEAWLLVEGMSLAMNALPGGLGPLAVAAALQQEPPEDLARALHDISESGHPDAERILAALSAPPEDCGGAWRYAVLKETLANPTDPEHKEMLEWLGLDKGSDFDSAAFSADKVNIRLLDLLSED